jgi:hypothetical protein
MIKENTRMRKRQVMWGTTICLALWILSTSLALSSPQWWTARNVLDTNAPADYAPVLLGQLKWAATNAFDELKEHLSGGMGTNTLVFDASLSATDNWQVANVGQLKQVAQPYWDRLIAEGYTNSPPWTTNATGDDVDWALANIGQLKNLFNFDVATDSNTNGLPDWWEIHWFGSITNLMGNGDYDNDSLVNSNEYKWGTCPTNSDTDADGFTDGFEVQAGTNPRDPNSRPIDNISGNVSYAGGQTGTIYFLAVTASNSWSTNISVILATPGAYALTNLTICTNYWFKAFRDSNSNGAMDSAEAKGAYATNPVYLANTNNVSGINITLADPDSDGDGLADWVETGTGIFVSPWNTGSSPTNSQSDADGINDGTEVANRTDPCNSNTTVPTIIITYPPNNFTRVWLP